MVLLLIAMLFIPSASIAGTITWVGDGGDGWDTGERVQASDMDEIKTQVDDNAAEIALRDEYFCNDYSGGDIGEKCNAAFAAMISAGKGGILWLPNDASMSQSTTLDFCDESGSNQHLPVILRGHGAALGFAGSRLVAASDLRDAAISPTSLSVTANGGVGGRDRISCSGCDFTSLLDRGDWITTENFTNAANNVAQTSGEMPFVVYAISTTYIDVEGYSTVDAGLTTEGADADATIQRLVPQVKACSHGFRMEDVYLDGTTSRYADFGFLFAPDNNINAACTASAVPYATCTGAGTGTGVNAVSISTTIQRFAAREHRWASVAVTSTNDMGQADNFVMRDARVQDTNIGVWMDTIQAHPALYVVNSDIHGFDRNGVLVTAGAAYLESNTIISESSDCDSDTNGACVYVQLEDANTLGLSLFGNDIEVKAGDGVIVQSVVNQGRHIVLRDNAVNQNDDGATTVLVDVQGLCGTMVNDGNKYRTVGTSVTVAPSVTFSNSGQATCPATLSGTSSYFLAAGAGTEAPLLTVENFIPQTLNSGGPGAASCLILRDSDDAGYTACAVLDGTMSCEADTNGVCGDAT